MHAMQHQERGSLMARIRTIKPEFPQSESMGRVSREARLLFILLWTLCDDTGRSRGDARLLKGMLYPYDEVTYPQIEAWLTELESEGCIIQYAREGSRYLAICNWLSHQKIDRPSDPKFPPPPDAVEKAREDSLHTREHSPLDQGPRTKDQGASEAAVAATAPPPRSKKRPSPKTSIPDDFEWDAALREYAEERLPGVDVTGLAESFRGKAIAKGWTYSNWRQAAQEYVRNCAPNSGHWASGQYPKSKVGAIQWQ
jgi:hypothetical protein